MYSIVTGTILLGLVHALIPNHWLPLVAIAKAEKWSRQQIMLVTFLSASAHVIGTVILGIVLGFVGLRLAEHYEDFIHIVAPVMLILFGLIYFTINLPHQHVTKEESIKPSRSKLTWILIFVMIMFLSPCLEVESLFLAAGAYGLNNILWLGIVYAIVSITGISALVLLAYRGINLINAHWIEHNEKRITGIVLIVIGIITFFVH